MKESETIKEYLNKLLDIANKIRLLKSDFPDFKVIKKILVTVFERYETSITSLENTNDLSKITLTEDLHALQAQEQQRLMREDRVVEGALPTKHHNVETNKKKYFKKNLYVTGKNNANNQNKGKGQRKNYPPYQYCGKMVVGTNHITYDKFYSRILKPTYVLKVKIGDDGHISVKENGTINGTITISINLGTKIISVFNID
ncbi:hypothetical protein CR513_13962, partial [Mucuna pruriens]